MKKFIMLDVDGILSNSFHDYLVDVYNKNTKGKHLIVDELFDDVRDYFRKGDVSWQDLGREHVMKPGFVRSFEPLNEAINFVENLRKNDFKIKIVTALYIGHPTWAFERQEWLKEYFNIAYEDIIFAKDKSVISGMSFVDDKISNVVDWSRENNKVSYLFSRPWNVSFKESEHPLVKRTNDFNFILNDLLTRN